MTTPIGRNNNGKAPKCFVDKKFEKRRAYDIVRSMETEGYSFEICEWGARGFSSIAGTAMTTQNAESLADFLDDGGCEALVQIMNKYCEVSQVISAHGCLAVSILAWSLRELKEFLGEIGACEVVVFALTMHIGDPMVSEYGTRAVGLMARNNISNSYRLAEAGACDALSQTGNFGFNLRHDRCVDVAMNVCAAFAELAEAANATRLLDCGAGPLVVELTRFHHKSEDFAVAAMRGICALASLNAIHREELGRSESCLPLVVKMLYLHDNPSSITLEGCEAIMHLSLSPNNANKLGECGGCEVVATMLRTKLQDVDFGAEVCTGAMLNLATYGENAKSNREKLIACGVIDLLRKTQFSPRASYKARENILSLLDIFATMDMMSAASGSASNGHASSNGSSSGSGARLRAGSNNSNGDLISIIHASKMKGDTVPLHAEVREVIEYNSFIPFRKDRRSPSPEEVETEDTDDVTVPSNNGVIEL
jgi:hypothetical protein